ncbi:MAG: hypothetical protein ACC645_07485, partial [Pirellulales bacterium]
PLAANVRVPARHHAAPSMAPYRVSLRANGFLDGLSRILFSGSAGVETSSRRLHVFAGERGEGTSSPRRHDAHARAT